MASLGLDSVYEEFKKTNPEIYASQEASAELQVQFAELGKRLTPITTFVKTLGINFLSLLNNSTLLNKGLNFVTNTLSNFDTNSFIARFETVRSYFSMLFTFLMGIVRQGLTAIQMFWSDHGNTIIAIVQSAFAFMREAIARLVAFWDTHGADIIAIVQRAFSIVRTTIEHVLGLIVPFIQSMLHKVVKFWNENGAQIIEAVKNAFNFILSIIQFVLPVVLGIVTMIFDSIKNVINGALNIIMGIIKIFTGLFTGDFSKMWEGIKQLFAGAVEFLWGLFNLMFFGRILGSLKSFVLSFKNFFINLGSAIKGTVSDFVNAVITWFNYFRQTGASIFQAIGSTIQNIITMFVTSVRSNFEGLLTGVIAIFNRIKSAITNPIQTAKDAVKGLVNDIKGFFSGMKLQLPKIKMPSFKIENWSKNPVDWLSAMPRLSVNWNAEGGIFKKPTIFNTANAGLQGVGEAGAEAIIPLRRDVLAEIGAGIKAASNQDNSDIIALLKIIASKTGIIKLNQRVVGEEMDGELALRQKNKGRGLAI